MPSPGTLLTLRAEINQAALESSAQSISITIDRATLISVPPRARTLVLGNPLIADVSFARDEENAKHLPLVVIIGKGYGATNLVVLDSDGAVLMEKLIEVRSPPDALLVYNGANRESYSCPPPRHTCSPRATLGDDEKFFNNALTEIAARDNQARGIVPSSDKSKQSN